MDNKILDQFIILTDHLIRVASIFENKSFFNTQLFGVIIGTIIGFIFSILSEPIKHLIFGPKLELKFNNDDYAFKTEVKKKRTTVHYIRVEVVNTGKLFGGRSIAKQCRPYLVNVERENELGKFEGTIYRDSLQLAWAAKENKNDKYSSLDLPKGLHQFIDLIVIEEPDKYGVKIQQNPSSYKSLLKGEHGKFQYTILVSGDNVKPEFIKIISKWNGNWDNFEVYLGKSNK